MKQWIKHMLQHQKKKMISASRSSLIINMKQPAPLSPTHRTPKIAPWGKKKKISLPITPSSPSRKNSRKSHNKCQANKKSQIKIIFRKASKNNKNNNSYQNNMRAQLRIQTMPTNLIQNHNTFRTTKFKIPLSISNK